MAKEYCSKAYGECLNPAGYAIGGHAGDNPDPPRTSVCCSECGSVVCANCRREVERHITRLEQGNRRNPFKREWMCDECADEYECGKPCQELDSCDHCKAYWERMVREGLWVNGEWTKQALDAAARF